MSLLEREQRATIIVDGESHKIPLLERGCDGCKFHTVRVVSRGLVPTYRSHTLESVEETFFGEAWCGLFDALAHGGPCPECKNLRTIHRGAT